MIFIRNWCVRVGERGIEGSRNQPQEVISAKMASRMLYKKCFQNKDNFFSFVGKLSTFCLIFAGTFKETLGQI